MHRRIDTGIFNKAAEKAKEILTSHFGDRDPEDYNFGHYAMMNYGANVYVVGLEDGISIGEAFIAIAIAKGLSAEEILADLTETRLALRTTSTKT